MDDVQDVREPVQPDDGGGCAEVVRPAEDVRDAPAHETPDFVRSTLTLYQTLLDKVVATKEAFHQSAEGEGYRAELDMVEATADLERFRDDAGWLAIQCLRWANERHPELVRELLMPRPPGRVPPKDMRR